MRFSSDNRSRPGSPIKAPFQKDMAKEALHTVEPSTEEYEMGMPNVRSMLLVFHFKPYLLLIVILFTDCLLNVT